MLLDGGPGVVIEPCGVKVMEPGQWWAWWSSVIHGWEVTKLYHSRSLLQAQSRLVEGEYLSAFALIVELRSPGCQP
jgi:hypothetical protein